MNYYYEDFTEENYRKLIRIAKEKYEFITYDNCETQQDNVILWRHDLDCSVHRAYKLALIEAEEGVRSTYFLHLHSEFYNALEKENTDLIKRILELNHHVALHFDPSFYQLDKRDMTKFKSLLSIEKDLIETVFDTKIHAFSFHNPDVGYWFEFDDYEVCNSVNTYSKYLKDNYKYCSDSNGYWRFERLLDVLNGNYQRLQILTHPEWWVPEATSPRERISRCIEGRSARQHSRYDEALRKMGRENVK